MIKSDKGHVEIKGVGADIIAEFGELVCQLCKAGLPEEVIVRTTAIALTMTTMTEDEHEDESDDNAADESDDDFERFRHMFGDLFHE